MSSKQRRAEDRKEAARVVREQLAREQRRRQQLWISVAAAVLLIIVGGTGWFVYSSQRNDDYAVPSQTYKHEVGFPVGEGPQLVEIYLDLQCPACKAFESVAQPSLDKQIEAGKIKVVYYPVAILDHTSPNRYSTRAAAATACAADAGKVREYTSALYAKQPEEGTAGPSDDELAKAGSSIGLDDTFVKCVKDGKYTSYTKKVTDNFEERGLNSTPSIFVKGKQLKGKTIQENVDALFKELGEPSPLASGNPGASPSGGTSGSPSAGASAPATSPSAAQ